MQRLEALRLLGLPGTNLSFEGLAIDRVHVERMRGPVAVIDRFRQQPDRFMGPIPVALHGGLFPSLAKFLFEGADGQAEGISVQEGKLDVLFHEHPERRLGQAAGDGAVDMGAEVYRTGKQVSLEVAGWSMC